MKKLIFSLTFSLLAISGHAQEKLPSKIFWDNLQKHCNKAYKGKLADYVKNDDFSGKELIMHVISCEPNEIKIPFHVGDDHSRTWILTFENDLIKLKHDHRHLDGSEDKVTQYGGTNPNPGFENFQMFPADLETSQRIGYASTNVWWITLNETTFTYNLQRAGSDKKFTVEFDLTNEVPKPQNPWGWIK
ncbi:hypothetical protein [Faecalibacter rhinopitheci]|uniref:Secreted protein n=1 Tax=Faecalibacter rhinopitheci TaxID=2779678 RepID=A0A8J7FNE9_9FLAO|nr:hypothetical protein [Faecalibacter rhinopitheci]MBF0596214.1 hypothetical protein [Faecalibacter rhinopitheci]MBQ0148331.1 hypothetical protein [Candidatus Onthonaster equi]